MSTTLLILATALPGTALILSLACGLSLRSFLTATPTIETQRDLDEFKRIAAWNMYAACFMMLVLIGTAGLAFWGLRSGTLGLLDLRHPLLASGLLVALGQRLTSLERKAQELPVADDELRRERDRVVHVWLSRPFPDW